MEITTITKIGKTETMTSLEIAEVTGRKHAHVMRDIRNILDQGVSESNFGLSSYKQSQPNGGTKNVPCYILTKKGCLILASGYDALLREKIINRWEELEMKERENALPNFSNPAEAARAWADQYEKNLALEAKNKEMKPKAEYFDALVDRNMLTNFTDTAKQFGLKRKDFIERLIRDGYLYRDKKNALKPYAQYADTLFVIRDGKNENNNWAGQQTLITPKGKETFRLLYHF